jgi:4-hydroxy-3-methylbut-2-enyl diphosphate reductase
MPADSATPSIAQPPPKPRLKVLRAAPRGFCAGVDRAIKIVELALARHGAPVYVRHEIVHNKYVVDQLRAKGAVFVEELSDIPETDQPVIFSAHGVAKSVWTIVRTINRARGHRHSTVEQNRDCHRRLSRLNGKPVRCRQAPRR